MESAEKRPVVHADRLLEVGPSKRCLEVPEVAAPVIGVQTEVVPGAEHRVLAQSRAENVERRAKLVAGLGAAALGPEIREQLVATERAGVLDGENCEQREAVPECGPT